MCFDKYLLKIWNVERTHITGYVAASLFIGPYVWRHVSMKNKLILILWKFSSHSQKHMVLLTETELLHLKVKWGQPISITPLFLSCFNNPLCIVITVSISKIMQLYLFKVKEVVKMLSLLLLFFIKYQFCLLINLCLTHLKVWCNLPCAPLDTTVLQDWL